MFSLFATNSSLELGLERGSDRGASLATGIARLPFGPIRSMNLRGGALPLTRTFDQRYQLNRIQAGSIDIQYTRDAAGQVTNVTGIAESTLPVGSEAYSVNSANNQMTARGNVSYTYDAAGNLTSDGTRTFIWDALGRLKQVQQGNQTVATYGYDIQNRRFRKTVGSTTTYYLYNLEDQLIAELSGNGTVLREYVWLDGQPLVLAEYTGANAGVYFYLNDHLGTPQQLLDGNTGAVAWQAAYLPFGEVQISVNTVTNNLRFPGQYYDAETGLHYNWNRYYDPASGRYISADPIGLGGGLNLYVYVSMNPINSNDFRGLVNIIAGVGFSAVGPTGIEASVGRVINPGFFNQKSDIGSFGSIGAGHGLNVSFDIFIGYIEGCIGNVSGETNNMNVSILNLSITAFFNKQGKYIGFTAGLGGGATPVSVSLTESITGTLTLRKTLNRILK